MICYRVQASTARRDTRYRAYVYGADLVAGRVYGVYTELQRTEVSRLVADN